MKVNDIVAVSGLQPNPHLIRKGFIEDVLSEKFLDPINCSIGNTWNRYEKRTLYSDYHDIVDRYTGKIVGKYRSHD